MDMQGIQVTKIGEFHVAQLPVNRPQAGEVRVRVEVTGLCRTDLKLIRHGHRDLVLPRIPGEEVVGRVCEVGAGVEHIHPGERVYVYPGTACGACERCRRGAENLCRSMRIMGFHRDGGFAQYVTVPARSLIAVPESLTPDEAVFAEPLSCCLHALELARLESGMTVAIWGAGPAGSLLARAAGAAGAAVTAIDPDPVRCARIGGLRRPPDGPFDCCVVAVGDRQAYHEALDRLAPRGRLVVFSGLLPGQERFEVSFNRLHYLEQTIVGSYGCCYRHGQQALGLLAEGTLAVEDLVSHRMPLANLAEALERVENRRGMKILLYPETTTRKEECP